MAPKTADLYGEWLASNLVWTPGAAVFRRQPLLDIGGFPPALGPASDYAVYLELARAGRVIFDLRQAVRYRQHDSNMSRDAIVMLNATMAVLRRERPHVPAPHRQQFRRGLDAWRIYYGDQIIQQLRADVRNGAIGRPQLNAIAVLLKQCRGLVLTHLRRKISRLVRGLPPAVIEPGRFEMSPESVEPLSHSDVPR